MKNIDILFFVLLLFLSSCKGKINRVKLPTLLELKAEGKSPLNLSYLDLDGKSIEIDCRAKKYTMINYWATWCGICQEEFPDLQSFSENNKDELQLFVVSDESLSSIGFFKSRHPYSFTYLHSIQNLGETSKVRPAHFVYNQNGEMINVGFGKKDQKELRKLLKDQRQ